MGTMPPGSGHAEDWCVKEQVDLIVNDAAEVVTVAPDRDSPLDGRPLTGPEMDDPAVLPGGALAMRAGQIVAVDTSERIAARFEAPAVCSARGGTVIPGLCDPHTHPVFDATREGEFDMRARGGTYLEITRAGGGIFSSVRSLREAPVERLRTRLVERCDRFLACGTTSIEAKSGYGLDLATELLALELLAEVGAAHALDIDPTCLAAHQIAPEYKHDRAGYVRLVAEQILPEVARRGLARSADVFCDEGAYTVDEARTVLAAARDLGLALRVHADELAPVGAAELAASMGAQTADHLVKITPAGIEAMGRAGTAPVLLPATCFSLRLREYAPARDMIDAGLAVTLATDYNPGTSYCPSMITVVSLACGLLGMTVAEALTASTRNAAATLGLPGVRGQLKAGAVADLVILDVSNHLFLGYQVGWNPVAAVIKGGRVAWMRHGFG